MNITPQTLLAQNHRFNLRSVAIQKRVAEEMDSVQTSLRTWDARHGTSSGRLASALMRNAMFGFRAGAQGCLLSGPFMATPIHPIDLRRFCLPNALGRSLGPVSTLIAGQVLVGSYAPLTLNASRHGFFARLELLCSKGLTGFVVDKLQSQAGAMDAQGWHQSAQACLWGAAVLACASTVVRINLLALHTCLAVAVGCCFGSMTAFAALLIQASRPPEENIVDFQASFEELMRAAA